MTKKAETGFEGTNEEDNFGKVLDFEAPEDSQEQKKEEQKQEQKPDEKKKPDAPKKPETPPPPDAEDELKFFEEQKKEEEKKEEGKEEEKKEEEDVDDAFKLPDEEVKAIENKEIEKKLQFSYSDLAKETGIEGEFSDRKEFIEAVKKSIDDAKTKIEFDLSKLEPEEQELIKFFRGGGKVQDILNPTSKFDEFLAQTPEQKAIYWLKNEKKVTEQEAKDLIEEMTENGEFAKYVKQIDEDVKAAKAREQQKVIQAAAKDYETKQGRDAEKSKQARGELVKAIKEMDQFMGMKLPEKIKNHIAAEIETGRFREVMDTPRTQLFGRLYQLFGDQILKGMEAKILEKNREGFNKGKEGVHADLHNIEQKNQGQRNVEESRRTVDDIQNPLAGFLNIDEDAVPGRE